MGSSHKCLFFVCVEGGGVQPQGFQPVYTPESQAVLLILQKLLMSNSTLTNLVTTKSPHVRNTK